MIKWLKSLFAGKKTVQKKVLEKISVSAKFKKKSCPKGKKIAKKVK